jgi:HD-GYP domain-containing protein (c-di-GMP phosphodiesterase class II)
MNFDIDRPLLKSLLIMGDVIEARDTYTGGHVWRVSQYAKLLGKQIGLSEDETTRAAIGGYLHDLGKVGISDSILRKKSGLDGNEFDTLKTHPTIGGKLIEAHPLAELALDVILHHHEQLDGKGYPFGLDGDSIALFPRLIAVADAFDAMTSTRPYRKGLPVSEAFARLDESSGSHFDAKLVTALKELDRKGQLTHILAHSDEGIPLLPCPTCGAIITVTRQTHDGDLTYCHTCTGEHRLHQDADTFSAEFTGNKGKPEDVQPQPDLGMIQNLVEQTPKRIKI